MKPENQEKLKLSVRTKYPALYKAFKAEVEKLGWEYNQKFTRFSDENLNSSSVNCLYFSTEFSSMPGKPAFSLSMHNGDADFTLENDFELALKHAKNLIEKINGRTTKVYLNENYTAEVHLDKGYVEVGCQKIYFYAISDLYHTIEKYK
jgi:hypothetical protein